jgi:LuxR family maltose regulon positive regulatory protein
MLHRRKEAEAALGAVEGDETISILDDGTPTDEAAELVRACFPWGDVEHFRSDAEALAERDLSGYSKPAALHSLGWARCLSGAWEDAIEPLEEAVAAGFRGEQWLVSAAGMALLARIALREGDLEQASRHAEGALELIDTHDLGNQPGAGIARVALGAVLARQGQMEEASILLVRGLAQLRSRGDFLELADALLVYAPVRRSLATLGSARAVVDEANALLSDCADPGVLAEEIELVARSLTPSHRRIDGDSDLTERELEVLRYLAEGLPKRDIGRILFLSYTTIHSHTKSIYQKLRVSSRQDAVERARELGAL